MNIPYGWLRTHLLAAIVLGYCLVSQHGTALNRRLPRFGDYPVRHVYTGKNAPLDPAYKDARDKTGIKEAARKRPDFAGHYMVAVGSCGTSCRTLVVIDAKTGRVYALGVSIVVDQLYELNNPPPEIEYRLHSRLMVIRGNRGENYKDYGTHCYEFRGNRFIHIRSILNYPKVPRLLP